MSPDSPEIAKGKLISTSSDWTFELIERFNNEIGRIAKNVYSLDCYPVQLELISSEQMMDAYASVGMPIGYHHWSFGKQFVISEHNYKRINFFSLFLISESLTKVSKTASLVS